MNDELMTEDHYYRDGVMSGRPESPAIEHAFQDGIIQALTELLEKKGIYQNVHVKESIFAKLPYVFLQEFRRRPLAAISRGEGDDEKVPTRRGISVGPSAPNDSLYAGFYIPNITIGCPRCRRLTTFLSMACSGYAYADPYPLKGDDTEQVFNLYFRCAVCRNTYIVYQVVRKGLKLQLTGRSIPFRPTLSDEWPKSIRVIVEDAFVAAAEGDLSAAYYHLRTAIEFYLKEQLNVPVAMKVEGSDLCERYNEQVDVRLKSGFPTFGPMYAELSTGLHSRLVDPAHFSKLCQDFQAHLRAKELFSQYSE